MSARLLRKLVPSKLDETKLSPGAMAELYVWREQMAGIKPPELLEGSKRCIVVPIYKPIGWNPYPIEEWPPRMEFIDILKG